MGTAVLFPQDCLRPRSRLKNQTPGMIYPLESTPVSKRNRPASLQSLEAGLLPLPGHAQHSLPMGISRRGNDAKHAKARKASNLKESKSPPTAAPDLSVYRILQRPKQGNPAAELLAHFAVLDKSALLEEVRRSQIEDSDGVYRCEGIAAAQNGALCIEMDALEVKHRGLRRRVLRLSDAGSSARQGSTFHKKDSDRSAEILHVSSATGSKPSTVKVAELKVKNAVKKNLPSGFNVLESPRVPSPAMVAVKPIMAEVAVGNDMASKPANRQHVAEQGNFLPESLALKRSTTEPPMSKHIVDQYTRMVMHISFSNPKLEAHPQNHKFCENGVDMSCEERWAGPAYSSSPPPDSLPLPKLCLPQAKYTSLEVRPLLKQYSTSVYMQPFREPTPTPTSVASETGGAWDAAFATKSLRRLLNLDPC